MGICGDANFHEWGDANEREWGNANEREWGKRELARMGGTLRVAKRDGLERIN